MWAALLQPTITKEDFVVLSKETLMLRDVTAGALCPDEFLRGFKDALESFRNVINGLIKCTVDDSQELENMAWHVVDVLLKEHDGKEAFSLLSSVGWKDNDTFIHSINVAMICYDIAKWAGMEKTLREEAALCGLLHDVGKLTVPVEVLKKPGSLTDEEREEVRKHTLQGFRTLHFFRNENVRFAALQHHERYDGSGYPCGLKASEINVFAQIVAIADVYDALTTDRVYRKAMSPKNALELMEEEEQNYSPIFFSVFVKRVRSLFSENEIFFQ